MLRLVAVLATAAALQPKSIHLIVNPTGGSKSGLDILDRVLPAFEAAGVDVAVQRTEYAGHAEQLAKTLEPRDALVGIGGDGTVHELVNGMMARKDMRRCPIGVVPGGTGNTWAADLGIPSDPALAAAAIVDGDTRRVDVMEVRAAGRSAPSYSINIAACGFPAAVLEETNELRWLGLGAQYDLAGLSLISQGRTSFAGALEIDGDVVELADYSFIQAQINARMGKRVPFAPDAEVDDGLLDLVLVKSSSGADIILANFLARFGKHELLDFVDIVQCERFSYAPARGNEADDLNLDGELLPGGADRFEAACVAGALEVLVPR